MLALVVLALLMQQAVQTRATARITEHFRTCAHTRRLTSMHGALSLSFLPRFDLSQRGYRIRGGISCERLENPGKYVPELGYHPGRATDQALRVNHIRDDGFG